MHSFNNHLSLHKRVSTDSDTCSSGLGHILRCEWCDQSPGDADNLYCLFANTDIAALTCLLSEPDGQSLRNPLYHLFSSFGVTACTDAKVLHLIYWNFSTGDGVLTYSG